MTFEPTSRLDGHVAVITGGKGAIGFATARRLAALGARIVSIDRSDPEGVQQLLNTLPTVTSGAHFALTASITDSAALKAAAEQVSQRAGRCDILINSAGFTKPVAANDLEGLTDELFDDVVQTMTGNTNGLSAYSTKPAGFAGEAMRKLSKLIGPSGVLLTNSQNAETQNTKYQADLAKLETRMTTLLARYNKQFSSMESIVGGVNSQKTSLKSSFDGMMSVYTNK